MSNNIKKASPTELLKAISLFDVDKDLDDRESVKKLDMLFHELITTLADNPDETTKEFLSIFIDHTDSILHDMGIASEKQNDEVDMGGEEEGGEEEMDAFSGEGEGEEPAEGEDVFSDETSEEEPAPEETGEEEIPDDLLDHYNPLIDIANSFIYQ